MSSRPLNARRAKFVDLYLKSGNATEAARGAGYSEKTAYAQGSRLLKEPEVAAEIAERTKDAAKAAGLEVVDIFRHLKAIATVDIAQAFDADGELLPINKMPEDVRRAIAGFDVEELYEGKGENRMRTGQVRKVKLWDKNTAVANAMKHFGLLKEKVELEVGPTLAQLVEASLKDGGSK